MTTAASSVTVGLAAACFVLLVALLIALFFLWHQRTTRRLDALDTGYEAEGVNVDHATCHLALTTTRAELVAARDALRGATVDRETELPTPGHWYDTVRAQLDDLTAHSRMVAVDLGYLFSSPDDENPVARMVVRRIAVKRIQEIIPDAVIGRGHVTDFLVFLRDFPDADGTLLDTLIDRLSQPYQLPSGTTATRTALVGQATVHAGPNLPGWIDAAERARFRIRSRPDAGAMPADPAHPTE